VYVVESASAVETVGVTVTVVVTRIVVVRGPPVEVGTVVVRWLRVVAGISDERTTPVSDAVEVTRGADKKKIPESDAVSVARMADENNTPVSGAAEVFTGCETERDDAEAVMLEGVEPVTAVGQAKPPIPAAG
jgi:hypothetical protein